MDKDETSSFLLKKKDNLIAIGSSFLFALFWSMLPLYGWSNYTQGIRFVSWHALAFAIV